MDQRRRRHFVGRGGGLDLLQRGQPLLPQQERTEQRRPHIRQAPSRWGFRSATRRIISNPSGGGGVNAALWVTAGASRFDGRVDINNGIALGGGATATLGTIGGSGPTAAAQAQWVEIDIGGTAHWIPVWT